MSNFNIFVEGNEELVITKAEINKSVNEHGKAYVCGYIQGTGPDALFGRILGNEKLIIKARDDHDNVKIAFAGLVVDYNEKHEAQFCEVEIWLTGKTYLMDLVENKRIFQNTSQSYESIMTEVTSEYSNKFVINEAGLSSSINHVSLQYGETDWAYVKRLASEKAAPLIPYGTDGFFSIGLMPNGKTYSLNATDYEKGLDVEETNRKISNGVDADMGSAGYYVVKTREIMELGDVVNLGGVASSLIVYSSEGVYDDFCLVTKYVLKQREAFKEERIKNYNIVGISLAATVTAVSGDKVQVQVELDGNQSAKKSFDFATVYSSQGDAGWYCMPEVSDKVRLYFPNENEDEAFVFNAMQVDKAGKDPSVKFFMNPQGKLIEFAPKYIKIANGDLMKIELNDEKGVIIESSLPITFNSDGQIKVESTGDKVTIQADEKLTLQREESSIVIGTDIEMTASQIHMQEF